MKKKKPTKQAGKLTKRESNKGDSKGEEYNSKEWGKGLNKSCKSKLERLQILISRVNSYPEKWKREEENLYRLIQKLSKANSIGKISLHSNIGVIDIIEPRHLNLSLDSILTSLRDLKSRTPINGKPKSNLTELFEIGGYNLIIELKKEGIKNQFLVDFIADSVRTSEGKSKIEISSLESFKTALSSFKKMK